MTFSLLPNPNDAYSGPIKEMRGPKRKNIIGRRGDFFQNAPAQLMPHEYYKKIQGQRKIVPKANRRVLFSMRNQNYKINPAVEKRAEEYFLAFDWDQGGSIDALELESILIEMRVELQPGNLDEIRTDYCRSVGITNKSEEIDLKEFKYLYSVIMQSQSPAVKKCHMKNTRLTAKDIHETDRHLRNIFQKAHVEANGLLENKDCTQLFRDAGFGEIQHEHFFEESLAFLRKPDTKRDELLDFKGFVQYSNTLVEELGGVKMPSSGAS